MKKDLSSLVHAFEIIARTRKAERNFSPQLISNNVLTKLLELTQLAPSSFNLQPYKLIVVRNGDQRMALSTAMLGGNKNVVNTAPVTVVFLADKVPSRLTKDLMDLELQNGTDPSFVAKIPATLSFLVGDGWMAHKLKRLGTHIISPLSPTPRLHSNEVWSVKNTALAAQQFMLAASALGLGSLPMEGFDERRVFYQLSIPPSSYTIPLIVSIGYSNNNMTIEEQSQQQNNEEFDVSGFTKKIRFNLDRVCYEDIYGQKISFINKINN